MSCKYKVGKYWVWVCCALDPSYWPPFPLGIFSFLKGRSFLWDLSMYHRKKIEAWWPADKATGCLSMSMVRKDVISVQAMLSVFLQKDSSFSLLALGSQKQEQTLNFDFNSLVCSNFVASCENKHSKRHTKPALCTPSGKQCLWLTDTDWAWLLSNYTERNTSDICCNISSNPFPWVNKASTLKNYKLHPGSEWMHTRS